MSVQVKGSGTIGGLDEGLVVSGIVTASTQINVGSNIKVGSAGVVTATTFSGSGASLTNLPAGNLTGALPAISGANLTGITGTTINNNANNRIITGSGTANTLEGESDLTFDGTTVKVLNTVPKIELNDGNGRILQVRGGSTSHNPSIITQYASQVYIGSQGVESVGIGSEHLTITNGNLVVASGHGIDFSSTGDASGMTSELLDDYEEGSFTPTYSNTGGVTPNYNYQEGHYTKIGNLVTCAGIIGCTNANSFGTGKRIQIQLPFTSAPTSYGLAGGALCDGKGFQNVFSGNMGVGTQVGNGHNYGRLVTLAASPSNVYYTGTPGLQNDHYFRFRYIYHVS